MLELFKSVKYNQYFLLRDGDVLIGVEGEQMILRSTLKVLHQEVYHEDYTWNDFDGYGMNQPEKFIFISELRDLDELLTIRDTNPEKFI